MCLILCDMCGEDITGSAFKSKPPHTCDPQKIKDLVKRLDYDARVAEHKLETIRDKILLILKSLPSLEDDKVTVETKLFQDLWDAAECRWHEAKTATSFLGQWLTTHMVLCEAFDVFRSTKYGKEQLLLEKLECLKEACDDAKKVLGYEDSKLDMSPEDVLAKYIRWECCVDD